VSFCFLRFPSVAAVEGERKRIRQKKEEADNKTPPPASVLSGRIF
ncbi:unnamed protein product, partial [Musa hybrid cultivar]